MAQCGDSAIFLTAGDRSGHCGGGGVSVHLPVVVFQLLFRDPGHNVDSLAVYLACVRQQLYNGNLSMCRINLMSRRQFFMVFFPAGEWKFGCWEWQEYRCRGSQWRGGKLLRLSTPLWRVFVTFRPQLRHESLTPTALGCWRVWWLSWKLKWFLGVNIQFRETNVCSHWTKCLFILHIRIKICHVFCFLQLLW